MAWYSDLRILTGNHHKKLVILIALFTVAGSFLIVKTLAASLQASFEAESSSLNGSASVGSDFNASGGKYVQLGGTPAP